MVGNIIHVGDDSCFRLPVLRSAGFTVTQCNSIEQLSVVLNWNPDTVLVAEEPRPLIDRALPLIRQHSNTPIIHFRQVTEAKIEPIDLVIPSLTLPDEWLTRIAALIEETRAIRAQTRALHLQSAFLREQSAAVRKSFRERLARSVRQRTENYHDPK